MTKTLELCRKVILNYKTPRQVSNFGHCNLFDICDL